MNWFDSLAFVSSAPKATAILKQEPEDFYVDETLSFPLTGSGEHLYVQIEKRQMNTEFLIKILSKKLGVKSQTIGVAGLKDRQGVTRQWLSFQGVTPEQLDIVIEDEPDIRIIDYQWNQKKLRRGAIAHNYFKLCLKQFRGDKAEVENRLNYIKISGFPNYFGPQRFGIQEGNINKARAVLSGELKPKRREQKYFFLSAARSYLFNQTLSLRLSDQQWLIPMSGDLMNLQGSTRFFACDIVDENIISRLEQQDIHITGPLMGRQGWMTKHDALNFEKACLSEQDVWLKQLQQTDIDSDRRALRALCENLSWFWQEDALVLEFQLAAGMYATSLLREIIDYSETENIKLSL
ncbi:MAG: tRNA pseudouridine(13) synthase TruD [Pseudomonadota bacterium]